MSRGERRCGNGGAETLSADLWWSGLWVQGVPQVVSSRLGPFKWKQNVT